MEPGDSSMAHEWARLVHEWARLAQVLSCGRGAPSVFLTDIIGQFIASCPVSDFIGHCVTSRTGRARCESTTPLRYKFVTPTPKKTCLKDLSRATSRGTHVTAGQLALALTSYAQVTDLAVNTAASGNNAAAIQSLDDRVTAELASKLHSSALAPAIAPLATAAALATTDGQVAAHGSSIAALQSSLTTGLSNKADQSAFDVLEGVVATESTPDGVDLKLSNYSTTAAMNGSIASANNATLATVAANYGLKTVVDQHSLDIAARITPLEVDTKVANALLGAVTAAALASELTSRDASISPAPSLLTPCSRPWTLPRRWTLT